MKNFLKSLPAVLIFALLFIALGTVIPYIYYNTISEDSIISVSEYRADDAFTGSTHSIYFTRDVKIPFSGSFIDELVVLRDGRGNVVNVFAGKRGWTVGERSFRWEYALLDEVGHPVPPGIYFYETTILASLPYGVERTFVFASESFEVTEPVR